MAYDITDDALPRLVVHGLKARGWRFDADAQEWRKHDDQGNSRSQSPADHARWFEVDVNTVDKELDDQKTASQMNATPGDTGTDLASSQPSAQLVPDAVVDAAVQEQAEEINRDNAEAEYERHDAN